MLKYAKLINEETKQCDVGLGSNIKYYQSIGMEEMEVEQSYDGSWYLVGYAPEKPLPTDDEIREMRKKAFSEEADPLKYDWEEQSARYGASSPQAIQAKNLWLMKKDEIRERYPYND